MMTSTLLFLLCLSKIFLYSVGFGTGLVAGPSRTTDGLFLASTADPPADVSTDESSAVRHPTTIRTLADSFVIQCETSNKETGPYSWSLFPLKDSHPAVARQSLSETAESLDPPTATLQITLDTNANLLSSTWDSNQTVDTSYGVFSVLEAVAVQWAAAKASSSPEPWRVRWANGDDSFFTVGVEEKPAQLFAATQDDSSWETSEWVEMVDQTGTPLGRLPRPLVHTHNLLHRGVGLFITKDESLFHAVQSNSTSFPDLYVHQRTATKRIFPSLYDMFVGGVATAGESSRVTAAREVAEELGLVQAPQHLSADPCLTCVICTSYNRCVVDLYEYIMDTSSEHVAWQEEEVAWGSFCSYDAVETAADLSIQRLDAQNAWPGRRPIVQSARRGILSNDQTGLAWNEWDFVPDGLLVWEAFIESRRQQRVAGSSSASEERFLSQRQGIDRATPATTTSTTDSPRRAILQAATSGILLALGGLSSVRPSARAVDVVLPGDRQPQEPRNRRLGGLASKIRTVSNILDELQRDLMQERWDLVEGYPAQLRSYVPVFTTYTDTAFPSDAPTDKGLRVALRYEVGRFFAGLERFKGAATRQALDEAYLAYAEMALHLDRYLRVGGLYSYYDDTISTEPYFAGVSDSNLVFANPQKDPPLVRDLIILVGGPDKGKTGIVLAQYADGSKKTVLKMDRFKGMREIKVVPNAWVAKRLGEQAPDDVFLIPRK